MATTRLMPLHVGKGRTVSTAISDIIDYVENPAKTDNGKLITGYKCDTRVADEEFMLSKREYNYITGRSQGGRDVIAYHTRQSFKPGEVTPEEANEIGQELALRFTKGNHAFIVCTHIDKEHIHNHIIFNSTALDCERKFRNFWGSTKAVRRLSDQICVEHGLSIIENPKPSKGHYGTWLGDNKVPSFQQQIRACIDAALEQKPADFEALLKLMEAAGIECARRGKKWRFRAPGQKRFTKCDALKGDYTEQAIRERIEGIRIGGNGGRAADQAEAPHVNLLIDIQSKIQAGKGAGYERWAKVFNVKEAAKTLVFLQENGLTEYAALEETAADATATFNETSMKIKQAESRLSEIASLQKHISNYSRTREGYTQYRKAGYSKKFLAEHEGDIILHQAAKKHFDSLGLKKLPTINMLKQEYAALVAEKKKLYQGYRQAKDKMRILLTVKANTDRLLHYNPAEPRKEVQR